MRPVSHHLRPAQNVLRDGIVERGFGEPDSRLLPVGLAGGFFIWLRPAAG